MAADPTYTFGPFQMDVANRRLTRADAVLPLGDRPFRVLAYLAAHAGAVVAKDVLVSAGWGDVAVTDNSVEQAISGLRRILGATPAGHPYIETIPRQGYRLNALVTRQAARKTAEELDALLAPHRAWIDGRAALESLEREQVERAHAVFERVVRSMPDYAPAHVGLANAYVLRFEGTRADELPDTDSLAHAVHHAREACRLDADYGDAWATLGFALERTGSHADALAAGRRAIALEPDNWRHHLRLSSIAWGEERLRAARRTLALLPGCALAHWLAATVLVARQCLDDAARELTSGITGIAGAGPGSRFSGVALHWLRGLICLAQGDAARAMADFDAELAAEPRGHLYARECCANTWYAIGVVRMRQGRDDAAAAFTEAVRRVPRHSLAHVALAAASGLRMEAPGSGDGGADTQSFDAVLAAAARHVVQRDYREAAHLIEAALSSAPEGSAGWLLPVEPLLNVGAHPDVWAAALACLRGRAA